MNPSAVLDLRYPIGALFAILGALLAAYGMLAGPVHHAARPEVNVDLWWGLVMLAFGALLLIAATVTARATARRPEGTSDRDH